MDARGSYARVNNVLNEAFLDGRLAGQPLYLVLDNDRRNWVANQLGVDAAQVEHVICACVGAALEKKGDPYSHVLFEQRVWRRNDMLAPPPFTAVLFTLSYAAAIMAEDDDRGIGANNYYRRLGQVTNLSQSVLSVHGKSTEILWQALNEWLLLHNYELGRPTARALNSWVYVGYAISQAIVRAGDREQFHDLFQRFGFSGNEALSVKEMGVYLAHWMASSRPTARLKAAWKVEELRDRIAETAIAELAAWSSSKALGDALDGPATRSARLSLLANVVDKLSGRILELYLGRTGDDIQQGPFKIESNSPAFHLANDPFGSFATLSPSPLGKDNLGLGQHFTFQGEGQSLEWEPRLIIPFARSTSGQWIEVTRVSFGAPHLVLVRDANNLPRKVEAFLDDAAITQPTKNLPGDLGGLPQGWVLFDGVQVRQPTKDHPQDMACLVPLATAGDLSITSGLQVLPQFFHSQVELEACFIAPGGPTHIEARILGSDAGEPLAQASSNTGECFLPLDPGQLKNAAAICFQASHGAGTTDVVEAFLRDANKPTPLSRDNRGRLSFSSVLSATPQDAALPIVIEGMSTSGDLPLLEERQIENKQQLPSGEVEEKQQAILSDALAVHAAKQTCVDRGYHYWRCETLPPGKPRTTPLEQTCTGCKLSLVVFDRGKKQAAVLPTNLGKLPPPRERKAANDADLVYNLLLDALCFLGSGSWGKLQSLIDQVTGVDAMPRAIAQDLFLLGFIDVELRKGSNAIKSWCVPAASVNFYAGTEAFLAGFRCSSLLVAVREALQVQGGSLHVERLACRPDRITITGIDARAAAAALESVRDPLGRAIAINEDVGTNLLRACKALAPIDAAMAPISIGRPDNLERFNVSTARWEEAKAASLAGAYRWNDGLQAYAFKGDAGESWSGPYQVIKLQAARCEGVHLHGYDAANRAFIATLGCDVPGILGRALVACSGQLPTIGRGLLSYTGVPQAIADNILDTLYPESNDFHEAIKSYQRL